MNEDEKKPEVQETLDEMVEDLSEDKLDTEKTAPEEAVPEVPALSPEEILAKKPSFLATISAALIDQALLVILTIAFYYITDFVMINIFGVRVKSSKVLEMMVIIYPVVAILYMSIMEAAIKGTLGKKAALLQVNKTR